MKNQFRDCATMVKQRYDVIEKENGGFKQAMEELEMQVCRWKEEKEKEDVIRIDLEDEVSSLKDEILLLKQNGNSASRQADEQLQGRLNAAEKEIKRMKELLVKERGRADLEKKNAGMERKKSNASLKMVEIEKKKASEAQKMVNIERKKVEENGLLLEKLKKETDSLKSMLDSERSKSEAADKKLEAERQKTIREKERAESVVAKAEKQRKLAKTNLKKAEESNLLWEKLKTETDAMNSMLTLERSKCETADKKVEAEKQKTTREKKRADLAVAKAEEQRECAETNLRKDRADDLYKKLEEERNRVKKLEGELHELTCSRKLVDLPVADKIAEFTNDVSAGMVKNDAPQWMELLLEKEQVIIRETKRADSETKKARKEKKISEEYKKMAIQEKHKADNLSRELEGYRLKFKELWEELQEIISHKRNADDSHSFKSIISEFGTVKLLKKQLKLEQMLANHAKKATKVEVFRSNMLNQELCHLKQEFFRFQQRLDILDDSIQCDGEGTHNLAKMGSQTFRGEKFCADGYQCQLTSGIDSRLDRPCRGLKRKFSLSSAINSSLASFSDRSLMGSPERCKLSDMTSAEFGEDISTHKQTIPRLSDKMKMRNNENIVAKAENSISPSKGNSNDRKAECCDKRGILDAVESLYSKGQTMQRKVLSQLHAVVNRQKYEPAKEKLLESSCEKFVRPFKREKTCYEAKNKIVTHPSRESMLDLGIEDSDACKQASPPAFDVNILEGLPREFDDMFIYDCMKLLDLNSPADEQSYLRAIAMPLSPMLPEIEFHGNEALEADNPNMLVDGSFQEGSSVVKNTLAPKRSFVNFNIEKNPTDFVLNDFVSSELQMEGDSVDFLYDTNFVKASGALGHQTQVSVEKLGVSDISCSAVEETKLCVRRIASTTRLFKYLVISSENKDNHSILKILRTISGCIPQCSLLHSANIFLQNLLLTLSNVEDLSMKERVCVFFTVILHEISEVGVENLKKVSGGDLIQSLSSITLQVRSALSDLALREKFMESCDVIKLLALIEEFLLYRKVLVCADVSTEMKVLYSPKINLVLNGNPIVLSELAASANQLVSAGSLLASVCSTFDHIGFLCETSCNIFTTQKFDPEVVLSVLHAFADICDSKYFSLQQYNLPMTLVKSIVLCLEKKIPSSNSLPRIGTPSKIWPCCPKCPFSDGALPMEDVASLLFENLPFVSEPKGSHKLENSMREVAPLISTSDEDLLRFTDSLSLIEILATFMGWDWVNDNIIGQLRELLESCRTEGFIAAICILIGQLGRLGVNARGYDDIGIKKLRDWLSAFFSQSTSSKFSLSVQFAIVTAFSGLIPIEFDNIIESKAETQDIPSNAMRKWFFVLTKEQKSLFRLQKAASETNCMGGFS